MTDGEHGEPYPSPCPAGRLPKPTRARSRGPRPGRAAAGAGMALLSRLRDLVFPKSEAERMSLGDLRAEIFPVSNEDRLPERVRRTIRAQQDRSEILIGWFLLLVVVTFAILYLLTPKTFSEDAPFAPVPWALSIYFVLSVIRLLWAYGSRLPTWSLVLSVVFDMALLMVLIWSFHIQYGQPASFYLKAPTLMYVFIFIALRALRFEARWVLLAGAAAAIGWGIMIVYVVAANPRDAMITRNYVEYLTSNALLLGAEFDKMISILMVTAIVAVALGRARSLLIQAVSEQTAARELSRFFDPEIAARIKSAEDGLLAGRGELRQAAVLTLDMRGFTRLAREVGPDRAMTLLADYQARMVPVIRKHGGSIDKFMGDGILATFGAAARSDRHAADALRALEDAVAEGIAWRSGRLAQGKPAPEINGAVASGQILFGAVGHGNRLEYTVIGDAVNLSAKIEKINKTFRTKAICDQASFDLAREQGYRPGGSPRVLPGTRVEGMTRPLDLVVLLA